MAGMRPYGVDIVRSPRYVSSMHVGSFLDLTAEWIAKNFQGAHASPPCQKFTELNNDKSKHLNLIPETRALLIAAGVPYIIENVMGARAHLINPVMLCGCMFGLGAAGHRLQRRRLFECSFPVVTRPCVCAGDPRPVIGIYGSHIRNRSKRHGGRLTVDFAGRDRVALAAEAMGLTGQGLTLAELSEAIPPAYTRFLGLQMRAYLLETRT